MRPPPVVPERVAPLTVLARGEGWVVVAKPPHLAVHRNQYQKTEYAALQRVRDQVDGLVWPVHRLDRAASGCLIFATDQELAGPLNEALRAGEKRYLAFVRGRYGGEEEVLVDTPMLDDNKILKEAATRVSLLGRSQEPRCSLLLARPLTGRFHQVRRHVRDLGHPIINDRAHGDTRENRTWRETWGYARLGLHCLSLSLTLPSGEVVEATCPLFRDQRGLFERLPWWEEAVARLPTLADPPLPLLDEATFAA